MPVERRAGQSTEAIKQKTLLETVMTQELWWWLRVHGTNGKQVNSTATKILRKLSLTVLLARLHCLRNSQPSAPHHRKKAKRIHSAHGQQPLQSPPQL